MTITSILAVLSVTDFDAALAWYERFFGRPADRQPMDGLAEWQITATAAIQLVRDQERGGAALLTLGVDDLEVHIADLAARGLAAGTITTGVMARIATVTDPEGNTITFAELLSPAD